MITLPEQGPSVADRMSAPSEEDVLTQILQLTPRGPAWGTDEQGDGKGASPVQLKLWQSIAASVADWCARASQAAVQALPTAISFSLTDWERDLGLPDPCGPYDPSFEARKRAVRAKLIAYGSAAPEYFIQIAAIAGYAITIEEASGFECAASECGPGGDQLTGTDPESVWIVRTVAPTTIVFSTLSGDEESAIDTGAPLIGLQPLYEQLQFETGAGGGELGNGGTRLVDYTDISGLECLLRPFAPVHTQLIFVTS